MSNDSFRISSFDSFSTNPMMLSKMENSRKINDDSDSKNGVEGEASSSSKSMIVPKESESSKPKMYVKYLINMFLPLNTKFLLTTSSFVY